MNVQRSRLMKWFSVQYILLSSQITQPHPHTHRHICASNRVPGGKVTRASLNSQLSESQRDCCKLCFTKTWLDLNTPDQAIQPDSFAVPLHVVNCCLHTATGQRKSIKEELMNDFWKTKGNYAPNSTTISGSPAEIVGCCCLWAHTSQTWSYSTEATTKKAQQRLFFLWHLTHSGKRT